MNMIDPPEKIYKYVSKEFLDSFLYGRTIKIGTLSDFHNAEKHSGDVLDPEEGVLNIIPEGLTFSSSDPRAQAAMNFVTGINGLNIEDCTAYDCGVIVSVQQDCHIFCASNEFSPAIAEALGYDACVEIGDPVAFWTALGRRFNTQTGKGFDMYTAPIQIASRNVSAYGSEFKLNPFLKGPRFAGLKECRTAFVSAITPKEPFLLYDVDMSQTKAKTIWTK